MSHCLFDLDALFINGRGIIVGMLEMKAPILNKSSRLYVSPSATQYVIEVKSGTAARLDLHLGMKLNLPPSIDNN